MDTPHPLMSKFERWIELTQAEREAINALPVRQETIRSDESILREGDRPRRSCLLVEGLACNSKVGRNGKLQILAFHLPEDMPDLTSLHLEVRDSDTWAMTNCTLGYMDHRDLDRFCDANLRLAKFLWRSTLIDTSIHRDWTVNVGAREGLNRVAHIFCELMRRMEFLGRARDGSCELPLTQQDMGEATGLSNVHMNRVIEELRGRELISFTRGQLTVHDWNGLVDLADFRDEYLHLLPADRPESRLGGARLKLGGKTAARRDGRSARQRAALIVPLMRRPQTAAPCSSVTCICQSASFQKRAPQSRSSAPEAITAWVPQHRLPALEAKRLTIARRANKHGGMSHASHPVTSPDPQLRYAALIRAYQHTPLLEEVVARLRRQSVPPEAIFIVDSSKDPAVTIQFATLADRVVPYPDEEFNFSKAINVGVAANDLPLTLVISSHVMLEDVNIIAKGWSEARARGLEVVYWTNRETPQDVAIEIDPRSFTGRNGLFNSTALIPTHLIRERPFREEVFAAEDQEWTRYYLRRFRRPVLRIETNSVQYLNPNHSAAKWNHTKLINEELAIGHYVNRRLIMPDRIAARFFRGILATIRQRPGRARMHFGVAKAMLWANFRPPSGRSRYFEDD